MSIPNILTILRIIAIPVIIAADLYFGQTGRWVAIILFIAAALTDYLDGYLARKWNQGSDLGRMLDPIADKLLIGAMLLLFAYRGDLLGPDIWAAIIITCREIFISGLREFMGDKKITVHVSALAKWKTTSQLIAMLIMLASPMFLATTLPGSIALWIATVLTAWTGWQYLRAALPHLKEDGE